MNRRSNPARGVTRPPALSLRHGIVAVALLVLAIAHIRYLWFVCDDAFITFRYAKNLAHGLGPVWNAGERVEGYTNFLWMMIASLPIGLGFDPGTVLPRVSHLLDAGRLRPVFLFESAVTRVVTADSVAKLIASASKRRTECESISPP